MTVFIIRKKKEAVIIILLAFLAAAIADPFASQIIKPLFKRLRPCNGAYFINGIHTFLDGAHFLMGQKGSFSFPSNHAMNVFTIATVLTFFRPKLYLWYFIPAALVAFSRVYIGVHYPLDVVAGAFFGILTGSLVYYCYYYIHTTILVKKREKAFAQASTPQNSDNQTSITTADQSQKE